MSNYASFKNYQRERKIKGIIPLALLLGLIIDSALPTLFPHAFLGNDQIIVSHLLVYFMITFAFYLRDSFIFLYAFLFGLLQDSYTSTVLGLYAGLYLIVTYLILQTRKHFPRNAILHYLLFIVAITFIDFCVYYFYVRLGVTHIGFEQYVIMRLGPTLIFNTVLSFLMYFPNRWILNLLGYDDHIIF